MTSFFAALSRFFRRWFQPRSKRSTGDRTYGNRAYGDRAGSGYESQRPLAAERDDAGRDDLDSSQENFETVDKQATLRQNRNASSEQVSPELRRLVYQATCSMSKSRMHAGQFGSRLRQIDATFSYEKYGFTKLIYLLETVPDIVALEKVTHPGAAPAYYVRSQLNVQHLLRTASKTFEETIEDDSSEAGWIHRDSLWAAVTAQAPTLSTQTYGFSSVQSFLENSTQVLEKHPNEQSYFRLRKPKVNAALKSAVLSQQNRIQQNRTSSRRTDYSRLSTATTVRTSIVHLSKFAGFSPQILNQKVGELAAIALSERWYFGPQPPDDFAYPILKSYLRYTFIRLQHERKVITSTTEQYRAFNTGLLDKLLRPIYALLTRSSLSSQSWDLTFCIPGEGAAGKVLTANFTALPTAANYLEDPSKIFYHLAAGTPEVDWHHIVKDNMERLPPAFLSQYAPANFTHRNTNTLVGSEFHAYKREFASALDADPSTYRSIVNRLQEALSRTLLKTQLNYKIAVPTYYPNINSIDLLLPICLVEEEVADCAIVVRQADSGKYIGHTILTLRQAYNNARLICKLDEHWLTRSMTLSQSVFEEEEDDSEEFESSDDQVESLPLSQSSN